MAQEIAGKPFVGEKCSHLDKMFPDEVLDQVWSALRDPGWVRSMNVVSGAQKGIDEIRSLGGEVFCITSPIGDHPTWGYERMTWLLEHFGIDKAHVGQITTKELVYGDFFVDDLTKNLNPWGKRWKQSKAIMLLNEFNINEQPDPSVYRARNWDEIVDYVAHSLGR